MVLAGYRVKYFAADNSFLVGTTHVKGNTPRSQTIPLDKEKTTRYEVKCFYEDELIFPIYRLGFMGKVICYMEINDGEMFSVSDEKMAEMEALARNTNLDIEYEPRDSDDSGHPHRTQITHLWAGGTCQQTLSMVLTSSEPCIRKSHNFIISRLICKENTILQPCVKVMMIRHRHKNLCRFSLLLKAANYLSYSQRHQATPKITKRKPLLIFERYRLANIS